MIRVIIPSQLESYTAGAREVQLDPVELQALTLAAVIAGLDRRFPGLGFRVVDEQGRIRRHIAMFIGETLVHELGLPLEDNARVQIVGALSGG